MRDSFCKCLITLCSADQTDQEEQDHCASDRDQYAGQVEAGDTLYTEQTHDPATENRADDANDNVGKRTHLFICPHDHARDPTRECSEDDPYEPVHSYLHVKELWDCAGRYFLLTYITPMPGERRAVFVCHQLFIFP